MKLVIEHHDTTRTIITVRLTGVAAALMCVSALMQVVKWIGGGDGGQAMYACVAAFYAVLWWQKDKELSERLACAAKERR